MKQLLNTLVWTPLRWALEEAWQMVVAVGFLVGALAVGTLGAKSLWLGVLAGVVLIVGLVALMVVVQRLADGSSDGPAGSADSDPAG